MTTKPLRMTLLRFASLLLIAAPLAAQEPLRVASPDGRNVVEVGVREGQLWYAVARRNAAVVLPARLGFGFRGARALRDSLRLAGATRRSYDSSCALPWGEVRRLREHYNELTVRVAEDAAPRRRFALVVRAFDDGVG